LIALVGFGGSSSAQSLHVASPVQTTAASTATQDPTLAQQRITAAKLQIKAHLKDAQPYDELALADILRARQTANPAYYEDAEQAIFAGLALDPNDFQLEKAHVALLLGLHEFSQAQREAAGLNRRAPDDVTTYG
jgi:hypothetical protein